MVVYNAATRELTAKIVYYGPGLGGKTTNLQLLHDRLEPATVGKLLNLATQTDRTIYFDLLPVELGDIKGYKIRFQLATVPGQSAFNETRRVVLKGVDGIVFVADSQWTMLPKNLESWQNLKDNLKANGVSFEGIPIVIQYNKRDLTDILSVDAMQEALGLSSYPFVEAVASAGRGVTETFKLISKLTFVDLLRRLQGRRPEEAGSAPARKEPDDLLSWKDSLLSRPSPESAPAQRTGAKRPLALVPSATPEEGPFAAAEEPVEELQEAQGPFIEAADRPPEGVGYPEEIFKPLAAPPMPVEIPVQQTQPAAGPAADSPRIQVLEAQLKAFERDARAMGKTLGEKQESLATQLQVLENVAKKQLEADVWLRSVEERLEAAEKRQRTAEDDVSMALRSLSERGEKFSQQLTGLLSQIEALTAALQEKTSQSRREADDIRTQLQAAQGSLEEKLMQGRREAEDIRTQIAPLLEAPGRRTEADQRMLSEFERLRESLAEALGDLSERLRRAARPL
jgi:signal recognition particle receptor subunit beta/predicted  nucleic acid-binding Zn-ribbon protein